MSGEYAMTAVIDPKGSLFDNIRQERGLWFGVIDGAQVDDIVAALNQTPLQGRPLYIGLENKPEQLKTASFLVALNGDGNTADSLPDENLIRHCFNVAKTPSACVFWHCDAGGEVLYHHLRSINKIIVPQTDNDGVMSETATETVLFRHSDANVMAQVLPALNSSELSRLLGGAELVLALSSDEWGGHLIYAVRNDDMPDPHNGFLQLSSQTYQQITLNRHQGLINKIEQYLDKHVPTPKPTSQELKRIVRESFVEAKKNGIRTQAGFCSWAYLYYRSNGSFIKHHHVQERFNSNLSMSKDRLVEQLTKDVIFITG